MRSGPQWDLNGTSKGHLENPEPSSCHKGGAIPADIIFFEASQKASYLARKTHCLESKVVLAQASKPQLGGF
jgi:hypothetical protein